MANPFSNHTTNSRDVMFEYREALGKLCKENAAKMEENAAKREGNAAKVKKRAVKGDESGKEGINGGGVGKYGTT